MPLYICQNLTGHSAVTAVPTLATWSVIRPCFDDKQSRIVLACLDHNRFLPRHPHVASYVGIAYMPASV